MITDKNQIKEWFLTHLKPTQNQFWAWFDSYWHKSEKIPIESIMGLNEQLGGLATVESVNEKVDKVEGKELSSNDFSDDLKEKLEGLENVDISGKTDKGGYTGTSQDLKNEIDNIQIGGRNLLRNSNIRVENANYLLAEYELTEQLQHGEIVTVTIWGQLGEDRDRFHIFNSDATTGMGRLIKIKEGVYRGVLTWFTHTYNNTHTSTNTHLRIYQYNSSSVSLSVINRIRLERGNKGTDWTPAPEDINLSYAAKNGNQFPVGTETTPPFIIPKGKLTTVPQDGAIERDENGDWYITKNGTRRKIINF